MKKFETRDEFIAHWLRNSPTHYLGEGGRIYSNRDNPLLHGSTSMRMR